MVDKKSNIVLYMIITILVLFILIQNGCGPNRGKIIKILVPEKKGVLTDTFIKHDTIILTDTVVKNSFTTKYKTKIVDYSAQNDSLRYKIHTLLNENKKDSIIYILDNKLALKRFYGTQNDSNVIIDYNGIVEGEVKLLEFAYTVKESEIKYELPKPKTRFFIGSTVNYKYDATKLSIGIETGLITNKVMYKAGLTTDKVVSIGIAKIF